VIHYHVHGYIIKPGGSLCSNNMYVVYTCMEYINTFTTMVYIDMWQFV